MFGSCRRWAGVLALATACESALGFEDFEHKQLGDISFYLATRLRPSACRNAAGLEDRACGDVLKSLGRTTSVGSKPTFSYGDIVQCVDLFITPEKLIAVTKPVRNKKSNSSARYESPFPDSSEGSRLAEQCRSTVLALTEASHVNHTHFQDELLVSLATYHLLALSVARERNLYGALLVNAIADHYLHDFFAPGHIISPRSIQTDLISNAMHDKANNRGAVFFLRPGDLGGIREVLRGMKGLNSPDDEKNVWCRLVKYHPEESVANCGGALDAAASSLDRLVDTTDKPHAVTLKGDNRLWRPEETDDGLAQRLLMVAAETRSILDVFDAYEPSRSPAAVNHFDQSAWAYAIEPIFFSGDEVTAALPFGYYTLGTLGSAPSGVPPKEAAEVKAADLSGLDKNAYSPGKEFHYWYPVLGLSVGRETFFSGSRGARNVVSLDMPLYGWVTDSRVNVGVAGGVTHYEEAGVHGNGFQLRGGVILPETETTLSVMVRRLDHDGDAEHAWRNGIQARFDQGFTSFLSLFLGLGYDYGADTSGRLTGGYLLSAGILIGAPTSRIPFVDR